MSSSSPEVPKHPSGIKQSIARKVFARRGRLHAFPTLDPARTALVVVDLDTGTVTRVDGEFQEFVPRINALAVSTSLKAQ